MNDIVSLYSEQMWHNYNKSIIICFIWCLGNRVFIVRLHVILLTKLGQRCKQALYIRLPYLHVALSESCFATFLKEFSVVWFATFCYNIAHISDWRLACLCYFQNFICQILNNKLNANTNCVSIPSNLWQCGSVYIQLCGVVSVKRPKQTAKHFVKSKHEWIFCMCWRNLAISVDYSPLYDHVDVFIY